ncbi:MAG: serpin family protein [Byssovorax sp.]
MRSFAPLLSLAFLCAACDPKPPAASSASDAMPPPVSSASPSAPADSTSPTDTTPPAPPVTPPAPGELGGLAKSNNALAFDLYGKTRTQAGNLALSPISISTALTMTWGGARGETAAQMKKVLHAEGEADKAMDVSGKLVASFGNEGSKVTLRVANRLFGEKTYAFEQAYLDRTKAAFGAPLEGLDFKRAADASRTHINDWVAKQTQDRIKDLIPKGALDADTRLVLTNAIYFLGDWMEPFKKEATRPAPFQVTATAAKDVPTMSQTASFRFAATDGVKLLEMPYQGGEVAMLFVLPDAPAGLEAVEKRLSPEALDRWIGAMAFDRVNVALPKFEINPAASLSLGATLQALGMPLAFDRGKADFTGIANPPSPADRLFISQVFHKAFVKLDEKGTEAAAATAVVMARAGSAAPSKPPAEFKADHPFLFVLRHVKSGAILFMGRVSDPSVK